MSDEDLLNFIQNYKWPYGLKLSETDDGGKMCFDFALAVCKFERERLVINDSDDWKRLASFKSGGAVERLVNAIHEWNHRTTDIAPSDNIWVYIADLEALIKPKLDKESEATDE